MVHAYKVEGRACRVQSLSATSMHVWRVLHKVNIFYPLLHIFVVISHLSPIMIYY